MRYQTWKSLVLKREVGELISKVNLTRQCVQFELDWCKCFKSPITCKNVLHVGFTQRWLIAVESSFQYVKCYHVH